MSKPQFLSTTIRFFCLSLFFIGFWADFGYAQANTFIEDDLGIDARVKVLEERRHDPKLGTGFIVEIDLGQLPEWQGDLHIKPVVWPIPVVERSKPYVHKPSGTHHPVAALAEFFGSLATIFAAPFAERKRYELPLTMQLVYPLDEGVVRDSLGVLKVVTIPADKKLHLLIPHAVLNDTDRVYFVMPDSIFPSKVPFMYTPQLIPDKELPDLRLELQSEKQTRYAGAAGKMVRIQYDFPEYLMRFTGKYSGLNPQLLLNGKYPIPFPADAYAKSRNYLKAASGELNFFLPDALYDEKGKAYVELSLQAENSPKIVAKRLEFLGKPVTGPKLAVRVLEVEQKRPKRSDGCYTSQKVQLAIGGIAVWESEVASYELGDKNHLRWPNCKDVTFSSISDSIQVRFHYEDSGLYSTPKTIVTVPSNKFLDESGLLKLISIFDSYKYRFKWVIKLTYSKE